MTKDKLLAAVGATRSILPDVLMISGAGAISAGAGMVYPPAGWVVGGILAIVGGWLMARGAK